VSGLKKIIDYTDDEIIQIVTEDFTASEYDREKKNAANFAAYRMFHCRDLLTAKQLSPSRDNVVSGRFGAYNLGPIQHNKAFLPWLRAITLSSVSKQSRALWPDYNDFFRCDPDDEDDTRGAEAAFGLLKYFIRASRYKQESMLCLLQAHLFDFAILYTGWKSEMKMAPVLRPYEIEIKNFQDGEWYGTGKMDPERSQVVLEEYERSGWDVASLNTLNFRVDPLAGHEGFGQFCGITALIPKQEAYANIESEGWSREAVEEIDKDEVPNAAGHEDGTRDYDARLRQDEKLQGFDMDGYIAKRYIRADMGWYPYRGGVCKVVILNKRKVALKEETWRIPFFKQVFIQNPGMFSGTSMVEPLIPAQVDMNQCLRLLRTQQDRAINPDSVVDPTFFLGADEAERQPWGTGATIMATRNPQGRDPQLARRFIYHPSNTAPDLWTSIEIQQVTGERASGISRQDQGISGGGASATEIARVAASSDERAAFIEIFIEDSIVIAPIDDLYLLMHANVKEEKRVQMKGEAGMEWRVIRPQDMVLKKSPVIVALGMSSMSARNMAAQSVRDITIAWMANPFTQQFLDIVPSMRETYRLAGGNPDVYVRDDGAERMSIPATFVPDLLASGHRVPVNPWDDHEEVIGAIVKYRQSPKWASVPEENKRLILDHVRLRKQAMMMPEGGGLGAPSPTGMPSGGVMGGGQSQVAAPGQPSAAPAVAAPAGQRNPMPQAEEMPA
jgi:hypothetical protein